MINGRKSTPQQSPLQEPQRLAVLDVHRLVNGLFPSEEERRCYTEEYAAGKFLIQQDAHPPYARAFLVIEGELVEEQRRTTDGGQQHIEVARIPAGAIAFRQGLMPDAEKRPSDITVRAAVKSVVCLVTDEVLRRACVDGELLVAETLVRKQFYDIIVELYRMLAVPPATVKIGENVVALLEKVRRKRNVSLKPADLLKELVSVYVARDTPSSSPTENAADLIAAQSERIARLERDLEAARKAGAQARTSLREYMEEVDEARARQTTQGNETFMKMRSRFTTMTDAFFKVQSYLSQTAIDLRKHIGLTGEELVAFSDDDLFAGFSPDRQGPPKVGTTCPPERIREAPTVPPQHEALPSARPIPLISKPKPLPPLPRPAPPVAVRQDSVALPSKLGLGAKPATQRTAKWGPDDEIPQRVQVRPPLKALNEPVANPQLAQTADWSLQTEQPETLRRPDKAVPPPEDDAYDSGRGTLIYDEVPFSDRDKTPPK
ncbi:MAG: hypothetical protein V1745_03545 [Patescibacteria group bacterium]